MLQLVVADKMRELDKKAVDSGIPSLILMENAGRGLASAVRRFVGDLEAKIGIISGPGQNGGDGFVAARHLSSEGFQVKVLLLGKKQKLSGEAMANLNMLDICPVEVRIVEDCDVPEGLGWLEDCSLIIDAMLGTGLSGAPRFPFDAAIGWVNTRHVPVVSCDLPSGLCADTGFLFTPSVKADLCVTMGLPKLGMYSYPGRSQCGDIVVEPLSLSRDFFKNASPYGAVFAEDVKKVMPKRTPEHHKGMSGHVLVVAGSMGMAGAAGLAAKAALRAGAGTCTLICPGEVYEVCASWAPEIMVVPGNRHSAFDADGDLSIVKQYSQGASALVLGPGLGRGPVQTRFVAKIIECLQIPCVLDADGLFALSQLGGLKYLSKSRGKYILTPHPKELANLMGLRVLDIGKDRPGHALEAAKQADNVVCLKGAGTIVANYRGEAFVNTSGGPAMATAGSGDVLSGVIGALLAQGLFPFEASWAGVFWHGLAGDVAAGKLGSCGMLAGDIIECLPHARQLITGR